MKIAALNAIVVTCAATGFLERANACTLAVTYEPFHLASKIRYTGKLDPAPDVRVEEIMRGHAGEATACANWGSVLLKVPAGDAGYTFEVVESRGALVEFPTGYVRSVAGYSQPAYLRFYWDDGATDDQEPLVLVVKIAAVSKDGVFSEPLLLKIEHPGVTVAR